jgi:hypothetical protein
VQLFYWVTVSSDQQNDRALISKLVGEQHRLQSWVEDLEFELQNLKNSRSWNLTKPLRMFRPIIGFLRSRLSFKTHKLGLHPIAGIEQVTSCQFRVQPGGYGIVMSSLGRKPCGFSMWRLRGRGAGRYRLFVDEGDGFKEEASEEIYFDSGKWVPVFLPDFVRHVRLDPCASGNLDFDGFEVQEFTFVGALLARGWRRVLTGFFDQPAALRSAYPEMVSRRLDNQIYKRRISNCHVTGQSREEFSGAPLFSVLMPVYNTPERWLRRAIDCVLNQSYQNFELCIVDDASTRPSVAGVLNEYARRDSRVRIHRRNDNGHISASTNTALDMAQGRFIVLMDHDDEIHHEALAIVADNMKRAPTAKLLFSDEDRISASGERADPVFKSGWSRAQLELRNIISHLGVYEAQLAKGTRFRVGYEGSQDWDFALRFIEKIADSEVIHIPEVLYHWRLVPGTVSITAQTQVKAFDAALRAVNEYFERQGHKKRVVLNEQGQLDYAQVSTCI